MLTEPWLTSAEVRVARGPGDLLDPFRPLPGPALPLHLDSR